MDLIKADMTSRDPFKPMSLAAKHWESKTFKNQKANTCSHTVENRNTTLC